jgi:hypothetical protein
MEDAGTACLCAGRRRYPPFYRTRWRIPMERYGATVASVNREPNRLQYAAGVGLSEARWRILWHRSDAKLWKRGGGYGLTDQAQSYGCYVPLVDLFSFCFSIVS